jgi:CO/xanthine dehydrogenase Mo-binding subunit
LRSRAAHEQALHRIRRKAARVTTSVLHGRLLDGNERRVDGARKTSGAAQFAADFTLPRMLWAGFATSVVPHARIVSIDASRARAIPGVAAVLTGADIGDHRFGRRLFDRPALAVDRVLFIGEYVAAVAAERAEVAEEAAAAIDVRYEELPAVFDPHDALAPDAPILHEDPQRYHFHGGTRPGVSHPNLQGERVVRKGDVDAGFARAARIFEDEFSTPPYHGGYLEPRATVVWIDDEGIVHVIGTNKSPYAFREGFAICTGVPVESVRVEPAFVGGDFGGKGLSVDEYPCYFLARATGRPIKYVRTYLEDMRSGTVRHASRTRLRTGVTREGRITAVEAKIVFNGGAYAAGKPMPTLLPGVDPKLPYDVPAGRLQRISVYTNTVPGGHMRAPGDVEFMFAFESHLDGIARELGIDPLDLRLRNAVRSDGSDFDGIPYLEPAAVDTLQTLRDAAQWERPRRPGCGRGLALGVRHIGGGKAEVILRMDASGCVEAQTSAVEQGMGVFTTIQRVIATELDIAPERVSVVQRPAMEHAPLDPGAGASRQTHVTGGAARAAAQLLRERMKSGGVQFPVEVRGVFEAAHGHGPEPHGFCGIAVDVDVDEETGHVRVTKAVCVADVGTIVNPVALRGQIAGGFVMGLGDALTEEMRIVDGRIENASLADYKLPVQADVPPLRFIPLEGRAGEGPFGAKMVGEINIALVAPAIANAIADACGARVRDLPLRSERVLAALRQPP